MAHDATTVFETLVEIIADETALAASDIELDQTFTTDLDLDSLSVMTIVTLAEDKFSVEIPDEAIKDLSTVRDAVNYILALTSQQPSAKPQSP